VPSRWELIFRMFVERKMPASGPRTQKQMTAEQIIKEIKALPQRERERLVQRMRELGSGENPQDFIDALEDFEKELSHYGYLPV
jgi:hypothetical protein